MTASSLSVGARSSTTTRATILGLVLQLAMVGIGHAVPSLRAWWGPGGMTISLVVGIWAGWGASTTTGAMTGGAVAGGLGALIGIGVAVMLGDVPTSLLLLGTISSTVAGLLGAVVVQNIRAR
jgi:hypothetical protein